VAQSKHHFRSKRAAAPKSKWRREAKDSHDGNPRLAFVLSKVAVACSGRRVKRATWMLWSGQNWRPT